MTNKRTQAETRPSVQVHIQQLVLEGIDLPHHQRSALLVAIETELGHLLCENGLSTDLLSGGALASRNAPGIQLANEIRPQVLGRQIAESVCGGIGR